MSDLDRLLNLGDGLLMNDSHGQFTDKELKEYSRLKKKIVAELSKIEEYKACKQYWYDKYQDTLKDDD